MSKKLFEVAIPAQLAADLETLAIHKRMTEEWTSAQVLGLFEMVVHDLKPGLDPSPSPVVIDGRPATWVLNRVEDRLAMWEEALAREVAMIKRAGEAGVAYLH